MKWKGDKGIFITLGKDDCCALAWASFACGEALEDNIFDCSEFLWINLSKMKNPVDFVERILKLSFEEIEHLKMMSTGAIICDNGHTAEKHIEILTSLSTRLTYTLMAL
jgi:hypothetical protein